MTRTKMPGTGCLAQGRAPPWMASQLHAQSSWLYICDTITFPSALIHWGLFVTPKCLLFAYTTSGFHHISMLYGLSGILPLQAHLSPELRVPPAHCPSQSDQEVFSKASHLPHLHLDLKPTSESQLSNCGVGSAVWGSAWGYAQQPGRPCRFAALCCGVTCAF